MRRRTTSWARINTRSRTNVCANHSRWYRQLALLSGVTVTILLLCIYGCVDDDDADDGGGDVLQYALFLVLMVTAEIVLGVVIAVMHEQVRITRAADQRNCLLAAVSCQLFSPIDHPRRQSFISFLLYRLSVVIYRLVLCMTRRPVACY